MAFRLSTGLRTAMVGGDGVKDLLNNGWIDIFTGSQPATADAVETGTKLARISSTSGTATTDGVKFGTAAAGVLPIGTPAWNGIVLVAGVAGWARFYGSSGTAGLAGSSGTAIRCDMSVGVSGADVNLSHTNLAKDSVITFTAANVTQPAE